MEHLPPKPVLNSKSICRTYAPMLITSFSSSSKTGILTSTISTLTFVPLQSFLSASKIISILTSLTSELINNASSFSLLQWAQYVIQMGWLYNTGIPQVEFVFVPGKECLLVFLVLQTEINQRFPTHWKRFRTCCQYFVCRHLSCPPTSFQSWHGGTSQFTETARTQSHPLLSTLPRPILLSSQLSTPIICQVCSVRLTFFHVTIQYSLFF